ncbi:acid trehalase [Metarhizium album ARSEF 1941]|uniref:alpha,alpha-trehalase n=1 Tax=Metarhizium album (strain ARSEF 1941) TaxID=1081103 RepID=A0A0B2WJR9_METAS|nr:acid trehalase [Metarhizium album ARSEF 1941]KHN93954.1 acid trehalase [Metarhizium album ARSEF 1941]
MTSDTARQPSKAAVVVAATLSLGRVAQAVANPDRVARCLARYKYSGLDGGRHRTWAYEYETDFPGVTWDDADWLLSTTTLEQGRFQSRGSVANGYLGISVASVGPFFELDSDDKGGDVINGWPLFSRRQSFATVAGFWNAQPDTNGTNFGWLLQYGHESVISGLPHWSGLVLDLGGGVYLDSTVDGTTITNFRSTYDFKAGVLSWSYTWSPSGGNRGSYDIRYLMFAHKLHINQAVVDLEIVPSVDANATVVNVLDGYSAVRTDFVQSGEDAGAIYSAVRPTGIANVTAYIYANLTGSDHVGLGGKTLVADKPYVRSNDSSIAQAVPVRFSAGKAVRVTKYVGAASGDAFDDPRDVARRAASSASSRGFDKSLRSHVEEWNDVMPDDSVDSYADPGNGTLPRDSYIIDSAIVSVANTYYLLQSTVGPNAQDLVGDAPVNVDSIPVGGLVSDSYAGLIFWDADLFMQPGLVASHPRSAERITNYRVSKYGQAKANAQTSHAGSQNKTVFSKDAAAFPWTSGRFGNCTATGPCWDYQYHLNGDVGISFVNQLVATGDTAYFKNTLFPVYDSIATFFSNLLAPNGTSWTVKNMTDPDEYANHVDAGGYTMPLIAETLQTANTFRAQFGQERNATWDSMAANVLFLRENDVTLEFTTMNGSAVVKQADVILDTFPLSYTANYTAQESLSDLDYSPDGPAMTWAFFSIIANDISPSGCSAYTYSQYSYKPYARAPFYQLSEQLIDNATTNGGTHPAFPFLTGHGGANQVGIFGYLGLRLLPDDALHINPNLPPQISHLTYRTFYWRGWPLSASSNATHTTVRRARHVRPLASADPRFANKTIAVHVGAEGSASTHDLPPDGTAVVPNRNIGRVNTTPGNLLQCKSAASPDRYRPGQFPIAANDGATSTKWQPWYAANLSSVTVMLAPDDVGAMVSRLHFNWAQAPPVNATVVFHNSTLGSLEGVDPAAATTESTANYTVVAHLAGVELSKPYSAQSTNLDVIAIPVGNTTNVTLSEPVPAARYATLLITGNQALGRVDIDAKNGTGATVAEWAVIVDAGQSGPAKPPSGLGWRRGAMLRGKRF